MEKKNFTSDDIMTFIGELANAAANGVSTGAIIVKDQASKVSKAVKKEIKNRQANAAIAKCGIGVRTSECAVAKISEMIAMTNDGKYRIIIKNPNVIVFWVDGTTTSVRCSPNDTFDVEKGIAMAILKKLFGNGYFRNMEKIISKTDEIDVAPFDRKAVKAAKTAKTESTEVVDTVEATTEKKATKKRTKKTDK